jgi:uncharacterized protein YaiE (UPF0345 family)
VSGIGAENLPKSSFEFLTKENISKDSETLMPSVPEQYVGVTVVTKANIYFDGNVVSHAVIFPDGSTKTLGLIYPGEYHFKTKAAEEMRVVAGNCKVVLDGQSGERQYSAGEKFDVPANSGFTIQVEKLCEYICSFLN